MNGKILALEAMKEKHATLCMIAENCQSEVNEYMAVSKEFFAIHREFNEIVKSRKTSVDIINKIEHLKQRQDKADIIKSKDLVKLLDKQMQAEFDRDDLLKEIQYAEFRQSRIT